jgi:hypothetical protein
MRFDLEDLARIVRSFLADPYDPSHRGSFAELIHDFGEAVVSTRWVKIALANFPQENAARDMAEDLLGELFDYRDPKNPAPLIVRYLTRQIDEKTRPERYKALLQGLIAGHIAQRVLDYQPDRKSIQHLINLAMKSKLYETLRFGGKECWALRLTINRRRPDRIHVDDTTLRELCDEAYRKEKLTPKRCRHVFELLDTEERFRNFLECNRFRIRMADVILESVVAPLPAESDPRNDYLDSVFQILSERAVEVSLREDLPGPTGGGRFAEWELAAIRKALHNFMTDFACHREMDSWPCYLKECLPLEASSGYEARYKYPWDTVTRQCVKRINELATQELPGFLDLE